MWRHVLLKMKSIKDAAIINMPPKTLYKVGISFKSKNPRTDEKIIFE